MQTALIFGGAGQVGRAVATALAAQGWQVDATTSTRLPSDLPARTVPQLESRAATIRAGRYDAVIDTLAFTAADAADLLATRAAYGQLLVISTASVYADAAGNGFETGTFPTYPDPIPEDQPTVAPGPGYSAGKVALEQALAGTATILRPAAIHGIGARHPREWYFVKRLLDGRTHIPIEHAGASVFHTTSATGLASLAVFCLTHGHLGAFNAADPVAHPVSTMAHIMADVLHRPITLVPVPQLPDDLAHIGHSPFSVPHPLRLSTARARALGWDGGPEYATLMPAYCDWLASHAAGWQTAFPGFAQYGHDPFDYVGEDRALALLAAKS